MDRRESDSTSVSLLARLRDDPANEVVWEQFVRRYRPLIYNCCLSWDLQPADAEDMTQAVLARLVRKMQSFRYDPAQSFRGWLRTVTRRVLTNDLPKLRRQQGIGEGAVERMLQSVEAREGLVMAVESGYDQEVLDEAVRLVRRQVSARQWEAFQLTALETMSGADASKRMGISVSTVYSWKSRVQKLVREEIGRIDGQEGMA